MAENLRLCDLDDSVKPKVDKLKLKKATDKISAIVLKIDPDTLKILIDEEYEDTDIEELQNELPSHIPSYVILSYVYHHDDGRVSYPFIFIFITPQGCKPELHMMYAGSKQHVVKNLGLTKDFELRSVDDFTEEWLKEKLRFFR